MILLVFSAKSGLSAGFLGEKTFGGKGKKVCVGCDILGGDVQSSWWATRKRTTSLRKHQASFGRDKNRNQLSEDLIGVGKTKNFSGFLLLKQSATATVLDQSLGSSIAPAWVHFTAFSFRFFRCSVWKFLMHSSAGSCKGWILSILFMPRILTWERFLPELTVAESLRIKIRHFLIRRESSTENSISHLKKSFYAGVGGGCQAVVRYAHAIPNK